VTGPLDRSPVLGPRAVTLAPGATVTRTLTQAVPGAAPAGQYTYAVNVGAFPGVVLASDAFTVTKQGSPGAVRGDGADDWPASEWPEAADVSSGAQGAADGVRLAGVSPNPARGQVSVALALPEAGTLTLTLYDVLGRAVAVLHDGAMEAGSQRLTGDLRALAPGVYRLVLRSAGRVESRALTVLP
jgi:hypothetical protein